MRLQRHKWGDPFRTIERTNRTCPKCGIIKVTRHDGDGLPWVEYYRDDHRIITENNRTPPCEQTEQHQ